PRGVGLRDVVEMAHGFGRCGRRASGSVVCWSPVFTREPNVWEVPIDDAIDIEAVLDRICAVRRRGEVVCWGIGRPAAPEPAPVPEDAIALRSARGDPPCFCAIRRGGGTACWGGCMLPGAPKPYGRSEP